MTTSRADEYTATFAGGATTLSLAPAPLAACFASSVFAVCSTQYSGGSDVFSLCCRSPWAATAVAPEPALPHIATRIEPARSWRRGLASLISLRTCRASEGSECFFQLRGGSASVACNRRRLEGVTCGSYAARRHSASRRCTRRFGTGEFARPTHASSKLCSPSTAAACSRGGCPSVPGAYHSVKSGLRYATSAAPVGSPTNLSHRPQRMLPPMAAWPTTSTLRSSIALASAADQCEPLSAPPSPPEPDPAPADPSAPIGSAAGAPPCGCSSRQPMICPLGAKSRSMKPSHWLAGRCCTRSAAATALRASAGGITHPASARATRESAISCSSPRAPPSVGASNGDASTSMQPQIVQSSAYAPPRGGWSASRSTSLPRLPASKAVHASRSGAGEQNPRRRAFCSSDAGSRTCATSDVGAGRRAAPLSARWRGMAPRESATDWAAAMPAVPVAWVYASAMWACAPMSSACAPVSAAYAAEALKLPLRSSRGTPSSTGGASLVAGSSRAHSTLAPPPPSSRVARAPSPALGASVLSSPCC